MESFDSLGPEMVVEGDTLGGGWTEKETAEENEGEGAHLEEMDVGGEGGQIGGRCSPILCRPRSQTERLRGGRALESVRGVHRRPFLHWRAEREG